MSLRLAPINKAFGSLAIAGPKLPLGLSPTQLGTPIPRFPFPPPIMNS